MKSEEIELAFGLENMRRMFRQAMASQGGLPGESPEETRSRIARDPATAQIAEVLGCSVAALMEGFGRPEPLFVDQKYDHAAASAALDAIVERAAGLDGIADRMVAEDRREGDRAAPHIDAPKGRIEGDPMSVAQIRSQLMQPIARRTRR